MQVEENGDDASKLNILVDSESMQIATTSASELEDGELLSEVLVADKVGQLRSKLEQQAKEKREREMERKRQREEELALDSHHQQHHHRRRHSPDPLASGHHLHSGSSNSNSSSSSSSNNNALSLFRRSPVPSPVPGNIFGGLSKAKLTQQLVKKEVNSVGEKLGQARSGKEKLCRSRIILISNLADDVCSDDIFEVFFECGRILHAIQWLYGKGGKGGKGGKDSRPVHRFKGKGFVTFLEYESAARALALSGVMVRGRRMIVEMEKYTALRTRLVYVTNLPFQTLENERALRALFEPLGAIKSLNWCNDERVFCGEFVGYVLLEFYQEVFAADCDELVDELVGGCNIQLSYYWLNNKHPQR
jgi:hypothetical protein